MIDKKNGTQICPHPTVLLQCSFPGFSPSVLLCCICISSLPSPSALIEAARRSREREIPLVILFSLFILPCLSPFFFSHFVSFPSSPPLHCMCVVHIIVQKKKKKNEETPVFFQTTNRLVWSGLVSGKDEKGSKNQVKERPLQYTSPLGSVRVESCWGGTTCASALYGTRVHAIFCGMGK